MNPRNLAPASTADEILTTAEVAEITKIPTGTLRQWRHYRKGPRSFLLGGVPRYLRRDLDAWLAEQYAATERPAS